MRLVCISDTHSLHRRIPDVPDGDILIHAGDCLGAGTLDNVEDLNDWLGTLSHQHKIVIAGNTDNRGSEEYNLALGERRAASVQRYLENLGVPSDQMTIVSYGELRPAAQGNTPAAWALNRRVDFTLAD